MISYSYNDWKWNVENALLLFKFIDSTLGHLSLRIEGMEFARQDNDIALITENFINLIH